MTSNEQPQTTTNEPHMNYEAGKKKKHGIISYPDSIGDYRILKTIGEGAFSIVKLVHHEKYHKNYACKIVPIRMLEERDLYKRFELEIRISQIMRHPGVAAITDVLKDENNFYIFMEYYPHGNLLNYVVGKKKLDEEEAKGLIYQILDALEYVHSQKVSHRDLKPENIMIDDSGRLRISDFGLSRFVGEENLVKTPCGSPCYVSPECISGKIYDGLISDIWSCGVILYAMVTGMLPWTKRKMSELFNQIRNGDFRIPSYVSKQCACLIRMLLTVDPKNRITLESAKHHTWFTENTKDTNIYNNYSIPNKFLKSTTPENKEEQKLDEDDKKPTVEGTPYLSTRKVDIYFRPDIDFDFDSKFYKITNLHAINPPDDNPNKCDISSPCLQFDNTVNILNNNTRLRKRRVVIQNDSSVLQENKANNNVNLSIVSSSGQLFISNKLYTKEDSPNSILADDNSNNDEDEAEVKDNSKNKCLQRKTQPLLNSINRKSARLPRRFEQTISLN